MFFKKKAYFSDKKNTYANILIVKIINQ